MAKFDNSRIGQYEVMPGTELSGRDISGIQRRRYERDTAAQAQGGAPTGTPPKVVGTATTGIPGQVETLYADQNMNNMSAYTTNSQIKELAKNNPAAAHAYTMRRDSLWESQNRQFESDTQRQKLGMGELQLQRGRIDVARAQEDLIAQQNKNLAAEFMMPVSHAKALEELRALENKNILDENEIERQKYYNDLLNKPDAPATQRTPTDTANSVMAAESVYDAGPVWDEIRTLATTHNVPPTTLNQLYTGRLAITYDTPMEMVQDVGIKAPSTGDAGITVVNSVDANTMASINEALLNNLPPDRALKQVLDDTGVDKTDKRYSQTAVDIAYAIKKRYTEAGEAALEEAQIAIAENNEQQLTSATSQLAPLQKQVVTPDGVMAIIDSAQQAMQDMLTASASAAAGGAKSAQFAAALEGKAYDGVGINPIFAQSMKPEEIRQSVMTHLVRENEGDPQFTGWMQDQMGKPPSQREPQLQAFLDAIVTPFNKGFAQAQEAETKKSEQRQKEAAENLENGLYTEWDDQGKAVTFRTQDDATTYREASTAEKQAMAEHEKRMHERAIAGSRGNELFRTLPTTEQSAIRSELDTAEMYMGLEEIEDYSNIPFMKSKGITDKVQLHEWATAYAMNYGLDVNLPELQVPEETKGPIARAIDFLFGSKKEDTPTTTTSAQPTPQPTPTGQTQTASPTPTPTPAPTPAQAQQTAPAPDDIPVVSTAAEASALPPGSQFRTPDGRTLRVPDQAGEQQAGEQQPEKQITDEMFDALGKPMFGDAPEHEKARLQERYGEIEQEAFSMDIDDFDVVGMAKEILKDAGVKTKEITKGARDQLVKIAQVANIPVKKLGEAAQYGATLPMDAVSLQVRTTINAALKIKDFKDELPNRVYIMLDNMLRRKYIEQQLKKEQDQ